MTFQAPLMGRTFVQADFTGLAYVQGFPDSIEAMGDQVSVSFTATSTTSVNITTATNFTITTQTGKPYIVGMVLKLWHDNTRYAYVIITAYNTLTGQLDLTKLKHVAGASTATAAWTMFPTPHPYSFTPGSLLSVSSGGYGAVSNSIARNALLRQYVPRFGMKELLYHMTAGTQQSLEGDDNTSLVGEVHNYNGWYAFMATDQGTMFFQSSGQNPIVGYGVVDGNIGMHFECTVGNAVERPLGKRQGVGFVHGNEPYLCAGEGAPIYYGAQVFCDTTQPGPPVGNTSYYWGLKGGASSSQGNIFDAYGIGFELMPSESSHVYAVLRYGTRLVRTLLTNAPPITNDWYAYHIIIDPNSGTISWYVSDVATDFENESPALTLPLDLYTDAGSAAATLSPGVTGRITSSATKRAPYYSKALHPAFGIALNGETSAFGEVYMTMRSVYCSRQVSRS